MNPMKNSHFFLLVIAVFINCHCNLFAQNLLDQLEVERMDDTVNEFGTFKSTSIAIGQSIENRRQGVLQLMVINRSWNKPNSTVQSFVADKWTSRLGLEYGVSDRFSLGGGWSTLENAYDSYFKYNLIKQRKKTSPFLSVSLYQKASYFDEDITGNYGFLERLNLTSQILIARKFGPDFSLQISPTYIHANRYALTSEDPENYFALGFGARYRIANHLSLVSEYYYQANPVKSKKTYGAFALGVNWDVRYLLLQFHLTNTRSMIEDSFILDTMNNFNTKDGNLVFGFNATFSFFLKQNKF